MFKELVPQWVMGYIGGKSIIVVTEDIRMVVRIIVSNDWFVLGRFVQLFITSGPDVSHSNTLCGFTAFLGLELKHTEA